MNIYILATVCLIVLLSQNTNNIVLYYPLDYSEFSTLRAQYKTEYKKCYSAFLSRTENQLNQNPRFFWDLVHKHKSSTGILNSVLYNDVASSGPESIPHISTLYSISSMVAI